MFSVQNLIESKEDICNLAKKLGFVNLRVFKGVVEDEETTLNILADLDSQNETASFVRLPLLEAVLKNKYQCEVSVTLESRLKDFFKTKILETNASLEKDDGSIAKIYTNNKAADFIFKPSLYDESDEIELDSLSIYKNEAEKIILAYDEAEKIDSLKRQIEGLSLGGRTSLLAFFSASSSNLEVQVPRSSRATLSFT